MVFARLPALRSMTSSVLLPSAETNSLWRFTSMDKWSMRPRTSRSSMLLSYFGGGVHWAPAPVVERSSKGANRICGPFLKDCEPLYSPHKRPCTLRAGHVPVTRARRSGGLLDPPQGCEPISPRENLRAFDSVPH